MRQFQKVLHELKSVVANHRPGDSLKPPSLMNSVEINGTQVHYVEGGMDQSVDSPPVVFIHGFGGFFMDWPRVMAPVSRHTRVYALDLPGWGFSEPNLRMQSIEDDARVVAQFLKKLDLKNAIVCGISYGAAVAWAAAALQTPRLKRAVLLNPMPPHPLQHMHSPLYKSIFFMNMFPKPAALSMRFLSKMQYKLICRENLLNHRLLDSFYLDLAYLVIKQPKVPFILSMHAQGARYLDWNDWEHRLAGIRIPVSILQGEQDRIFSMKSALALHRLIPTSELIPVEDCGHAMVFDQHKKVSDHLIRTVKGAVHGTVQAAR